MSTRLSFSIGICLIGLAVPILLLATPQPRVEKGDRVAGPASSHVVRIIPPDRPHVPMPVPTPALATNKAVQNTAPLSPEAEPPPPNERDLLEPDQTTSAVEHRRARHIDICSRHGGHRVEFHRGRRVGWRCVYPRRRQK